jgi:hypothetical protein
LARAPKMNASPRPATIVAIRGVSCGIVQGAPFCSKWRTAAKVAAIPIWWRGPSRRNPDVAGYPAVGTFNENFCVPQATE